MLRSLIDEIETAGENGKALATYKSWTTCAGICCMVLLIYFFIIGWIILCCILRSNRMGILVYEKIVYGILQKHQEYSSFGLVWQCKQKGALLVLHHVGVNPDTATTTMGMVPMAMQQSMMTQSQPMQDMSMANLQNQPYSNQGFVNQGYANQGYANQGNANANQGYANPGQMNYQPVNVQPNQSGY